MVRLGAAVLVLLLLVLLGGCRNTTPEQLPVAEFTYAPSVVRVGDEVLFDASASRADRGQIVGFAWDFGDGTSGHGMSPAHVYAAAGSYTVTLTVTDDRGREGVAQATLDVLPEVAPPLPGGPRALFTAEPREGVAPLTVSFDATASTGDIISYRWAFGDGGVAAGITVTHTYTAPGTYTARLTVEDGNGRTHTATRSVTVRPPAGGPLHAAFTVDPNPATVGQTVRFDASTSTGTIASYRWEFGDGATAVGKTVQHTYTAPGEYRARLTVRDPYGNTHVAEKPVWIAPVLPPPPG